MSERCVEFVVQVLGEEVIESELEAKAKCITARTRGGHRAELSRHAALAMRMAPHKRRALECRAAQLKCGRA